MSLPTSPPKYPSNEALYAPIIRSESGWRVYALQRALGFSSADADGAFGPYTEQKVKEYQLSRGISPVGYAGPTTQRTLLLDAVAYAEGQRSRMPKGILKGFLIYEGGSLLAPTNWYTPPGGTPGVDCGPVQWRQYGPPFALDGLKMAFNPRTSFLYAADAFLERLDSANVRRPSLTDDQAINASILAHNWPSGYEQIVKYGHILNPDDPAGWTNNPLTGKPYTRGEWAVEYPRRIRSASTL